MPWPDLPPPNTLLPFEATVRHGSMTAAAQELHVTHGAVSRQIQNLERALGTTLFERAPRSLRPTPEARQLAAVISESLDRIDTAARLAARRPHPGRPLTLSCEPTLLMRWLIPRLPHLAANVPDLTVHLSAGGGPDALDDVDVAIRRDDFAFPGRVSGTRLFGERIGPVCRPDLAGELLGEAPFAGATLLHTRTRPGAWEDWRRLTGTGPTPDASDASPQQTFEHFYLTLQAAAAGVGVAIGPYALVHDEVTQGRLAAPFGFVADGTSYHLLSHRPPAEDPQVARLLTWLRAQTSSLNAPTP